MYLGMEKFIMQIHLLKKQVQITTYILRPPIFVSHGHLRDSTILHDRQMRVLQAITTNWKHFGFFF